MTHFRSTAWRLAPLLLPLVIAFWWTEQGRGGVENGYAYPSIASIGLSFVGLSQSGDLVNNVIASCVRAILGLGFGSAVGLLLGVGMAESTALRGLLAPLLRAFQHVPILGWLPLIALWAGNGDTAKLLIVMMAVFSPVLLSVEAGLESVDRAWIEVGRLAGFGRFRMFVLVKWPAALPHVFTGLSQALAFAWTATIGSELLLSSGNGLGVVMERGQANAQIDIVMVGVVCVGIAGFAMHKLLALLRLQILHRRPR